jgi:hypothetical protein
MTGHRIDSVGMGHGRDWNVLPDDECVVDWSVHPDQGLVQGPLDLEFLSGRRVALNLEPGQVALLICDNDLQAVYLDGGHILDIGEGRGQVPCRGNLVFLAVGQGLDVGWSAPQPLQLGENGPGLIGHCNLAIDTPGRFYHTFLAGDADWDETFILRLVRQATRAALERVLGDAGDDAARLQARLANLQAEDLDEELAPLGLACRRASVYTAAPPIEVSSADATGQFPGLGHN